MNKQTQINQDRKQKTNKKKTEKGKTPTLVGGLLTTRPMSHWAQT